MKKNLGWLNIRFFFAGFISLFFLILMPTATEKIEWENQIRAIKAHQCSENPLITAQIFRKFDFPAIERLPKQSNLADLFKTIEGESIISKSCWLEHREYLKAMLAHYQYGHMPPRPNQVQLQLEKMDVLFQGKGVRYTGTLKFRARGKEIRVRVGVVRPVAKGLFPLIVANSNYLFDYSPITNPKKLSKYQQQKRLEIEEAVYQEAVKRGYAVVKFLRQDFVPDRQDARKYGVLSLYSDYDWGSIAVWAWGTSVVIDAFTQNTDWSETEKIVTTGHSRGGKAALCAGIFDERIALTVPNSSGGGGTASVRFFEPGRIEQRLAHHTKRFPHWWTPNYYKFAGYEEQLPFDAHTAKAVIAPRALLNTHATEDYWANPYGTKVTFLAAQEVFKWLGVPERQALHWRSGGHQQKLEDWLILLDFADWLFFGKPRTGNYDPQIEARHRTHFNWGYPEIKPSINK